MTEKRIENNKKGLWLGILFVSLGAFCVIAYFVATGQAGGFDDPIRQFFYDVRSGGLTTFMEAVTYLGNWQSIVVLCLLLLAYDNTRMVYGVPVSLVAVSDTGLNKILKMLFERSRPDDILHLVQESGYSFPSGHSITSMAVFGTLLYLVQTRMENKKLANRLSALLILLILLIGPSRVYLGVHYPTDILGGWALGIFVATLVLMIWNRYQAKKAEGIH